MEDMTHYGNYGINRFDPRGNYMIHFDIKTDNIVLGYAPDLKDRDDATSNYPVIKMVDFRLADLTNAEDGNNPRRYKRCGTKGFRTPVSFLPCRESPTKADLTHRNNGAGAEIGPDHSMLRPINSSPSTTCGALVK